METDGSPQVSGELPFGGQAHTEGLMIGADDPALALQEIDVAVHAAVDNLGELVRERLPFDPFDLPF